MSGLDKKTYGAYEIAKLCEAQAGKMLKKTWITKGKEKNNSKELANGWALQSALITALIVNGECEAFTTIKVR